MQTTAHFLCRYRRHGVGTTGILSAFSESLNIHLFHHAPWCVSVRLLVVLWRGGLNAGFKGKQQLSVTLCGDTAENSVWEQEILLQYLFSTVIDGHFFDLSLMIGK